MEALRKKKKERSSAETKRRIVDAATAEFAAKGFDGARLGSIARVADVQQALIHHYFSDKEGLHAEVLKNGLGTMAKGVWELATRLEGSPTAPRRKRRPEEIRVLAEGFIDLLLRFFASNESFLAILRHETRRDEGEGTAKRIVTETIRPLFETITSGLDAMRARGELRADVDARHLVLSCVAMVAFPFEEEPFVAAIWPADWHDETFLAERRKQIVDVILARALPLA